MTIELAISTLQQYKNYSKTKELEFKYPHEMQRRDAYLDNVIRQLLQCERRDNSANTHLVADDIRHCMMHKYYPGLSSEDESDGFNFKNTLSDVAELLDA